MTLGPAARRAARTAFQSALALLTVVPAALAALPAGSPLAAEAAVILAGVTAVSGLVNRLEDAGLIPAWLKDPDPAVLLLDDVIRPADDDGEAGPPSAHVLGDH